MLMNMGPQHPSTHGVLRLVLELDGETIKRSKPVIGYLHTGMEKTGEDLTFVQGATNVTRMDYASPLFNELVFSLATEELLGIEVPERALYLRTIWAELARVHSHIFWFGVAADAFGFESLFMQSMRLREAVLDIFEATTGARVILGVCKVGGVRRDMAAETLKGIVARLTALKTDLDELSAVFINDYSIKHRLVGVGYISKEDAYVLGCVGPMARASGLAMDMRALGYAAYKNLDVEPMVETGGDCYARCLVRIRETFHSIDLIRQAAGKMPEGPLDLKVKGTPNGEYFSRIEQPRGEVIHYVKANGSKFLQRFRVRVPTFSNIPAMIKVLKGSEVADVPNIILTLDPCISCTER